MKFHKTSNSRIMHSTSYILHNDDMYFDKKLCERNFTLTLLIPFNPKLLLHEKNSEVKFENYSNCQTLHSKMKVCANIAPIWCFR